MWYNIETKARENNKNMQKKLLAFLMGFMPLSAMAETVVPGISGVINNMPNGLDTSNNTFVFNAGKGIRVTGNILVTNSFYIGTDYSTGVGDGFVYAESGIDKPYYVTSTGNITIGQALNIADGKKLIIGGANGHNADFTAGAIVAAGDLEFVNVGDINVNQFSSSQNSTVNVKANSWHSNVFQMLDSSNVSINLGHGAMSVEGNIENQSGGTLNIIAGNLTAAGMENGDVSGDIVLKLDSLNLTGGSSSVASLISKGNFSATVAGATNFAHGVDLTSMGATNGFQLVTNTLTIGDHIDSFYHNNLTEFIVKVTGGNIDAGEYTIVNGSSNANANMQLTGQNIVAGAVLNNANMNLNTSGTLNIADNITNAGGVLNIVANTISVPTFNANGGLVNVNGIFSGLNELNVVGNLYQNANSSVGTDGVMNIQSNNYTLNANHINVGGIVQTGNSDVFVMQTNDLDVIANGINVHNLTIQSTDLTTGADINVVGDVSGGVQIFGLGHMTVNGDYTFDTDSMLLAVINPESADNNYWATVTYGTDPQDITITNNSSSPEPIISVTGQVINNVPDSFGMGNSVVSSTFGIVLNTIIDQGSAIWLMHAGEGFTNEFDKLNIAFCNSTGTICVDYLDAFDDNNGTDDDLPIYMVTYGDDVYVVFDDRFENPIGLFKLQPVVGSTHHLTGEYQSAGALDDLIEARLYAKDFSYDSPLIVVKELFDGTVLENVSDELYNRMHEYARRGNARIIKHFSRLFQPNEANQIVNNIAMNRYSEFRDMADMFIDEAIWNRNHRLNKLWVKGDYTMFTNHIGHSHADGTRLGLSFGYDWQSSLTLVLGWTGHITQTDNKNVDNIDLSYGRVTGVTGTNETNVTDTGFGFGGYFMKTLSNKARFYGDLMLDFNIIDVDRSQTWVEDSSGDAFAYGIMAEAGLIHDWLNQYIIGNLYARAGYNFGFKMNEKIGDEDYLNFKFNGHAVLTPGYSLTAQKRVYPSAWFEFRPYATVGIEYGLLGPGDTDYKFALANAWTKYDTSVDPLWINGGGGIEFLSVTGIHAGIGYRYTYNDNLQIHKIHASFKYRF